MLGALLVCMICINGMNVLNSYVGRFFMSAIERKDMGLFIYYALADRDVFSLCDLMCGRVERALGGRRKALAAK